MHASLFRAFVFAAALLLLVPACRRGASQSSASSPSPVVVVVTATPSASASASSGSPESLVTADPALASQRNAARRSRRIGETDRTRSVGHTASVSAAGEVPEGTILRVAFDQTISSATAHIGDRIRGRLLDDLVDDAGRVAAPAGARVEGSVEDAAPSGRLSGQARLAFRLTDLDVGGRDVPVATSEYRHVSESHTRHDAEYIAGGAAVGALVGQLVGRDTSSTLKGAAAGAAAGTGAAAATGAADVEIQAGRTVAFTLQRPLRLR